MYFRYIFCQARQRKHAFEGLLTQGKFLYQQEKVIVKNRTLVARRDIKKKMIIRPA